MIPVQKVEDMKVGMKVSLKNQGGALKLSLEDSKCDIEDVDIKMDGGASWLYQGYGFKRFNFAQAILASCCA